MGCNCNKKFKISSLVKKHTETVKSESVSKQDSNLSILKQMWEESKKKQADSENNETTN